MGSSKLSKAKDGDSWLAGDVVEQVEREISSSATEVEVEEG